MEITILSAEGLKSTTHLLSQRLRPFLSITMAQPSTTTNGDENCHVYTTRVDDHGGVNPTWGDKFYLPVDPTFFANGRSSVNLQLYTKRLITGRRQLGWCQVPVTDIGFLPVGSVRYLSYRLRDRDGTRGHGVVNIAVKVTGSMKPMDDAVIGIPVTACSHLSDYRVGPRC